MQIKRGTDQKTGPTHWCEDNNHRALCGVLVLRSKPITKSKFKLANHCKRCIAIALAKAKEVGTTPFLKKDFKLEQTKYISISDLNSLIDAAGIDKDTAVVRALRDELKARGFQSHWIRRESIRSS